MSDDTIEYPKDTVGYHWQMSRAVFGVDSAPTKYLERKASESPHGMNEPVIGHETQVLYLLGQMFIKEQEIKKQDEDAGYYEHAEGCNGMCLNGCNKRVNDPAPR